MNKNTIIDIALKLPRTTELIEQLQNIQDVVDELQQYAWDLEEENKRLMSELLTITLKYTDLKLQLKS